MSPSGSTLMENTTNNNNNTLVSTLVQTNKWCLRALIESISWWMNWLSTQNGSHTINSLHHQQQTLTTLSSPKQPVHQQFLNQQWIWRIKANLRPKQTRLNNQTHIFPNGEWTVRQHGQTHLPSTPYDLQILTCLTPLLSLTNLNRNEHNHI